jgi:hypothetical protein
MRRALRLLLGLFLGTSASACLSNAAARGAPSDAGFAPGPPGTVAIVTDGGVAISPMAFGQNYWNWVDWANDGMTGLTGTEPLTAALHLNAIRAGGNNNDDSNPVVFDSNQIDAFVAYCREAGAEPILQVPLVAGDPDGGAATVKNAADMVTYANVTKGYGIKYWEIGNEPDLYASVQPPAFPIRTATEYCAQYSAYVAGMKAANAAAPDGGAPIQFLGPEVSQPNIGWLTTFLDGCKDSVDIVTVHRYPFGPTQTLPAGALNDVTSLRSVVASLADVVKTHARPHTPLGITESNISYEYRLGMYTQSSLEASPGTFYAGVWTADAMGVALESGLWTFAPWNIGEQSRTGSVLGYIVGAQPTPAYYAEQMISANFSGQSLVPAGVPAGFSLYASHDPGKGSTAVLVVNKTSAASTLGLVIDARPAQSFDFPALSITLVQIPDAAGAAAQVVRYTADMAAAGMPPQTIQ